MLRQHGHALQGFLENSWCFNATLERMNNHFSMLLSRLSWTRRLLVLLTALTLICIIPIGDALKGNRSITSHEMMILGHFHNAPDLLLAISTVIGRVFSIAGTALIVSVFLFYLIWTEHGWVQPVRGAIIAVTPMMVTLVVKLVVNRNRPGTPLGSLASDPSFPSGHVTASTSCVALLFLILQVRRVRKPPRRHRCFLRLATVVILTLIPVLTAVSRLILGVHYSSDVVASLILNALLAASLGVISQHWTMETS